MKPPPLSQIIKAGRLIKHRWPWAAAAVAFSAVTALGMTAWMAIVDIPQIGPAAQSSTVLDHHGRVIATLHAEEDRTIVPLHRISPNLQKAVLWVEDRDFFDHRGMSAKAVVRAAAANLTGGEIQQGGSTITQQYVRNVLPQVGKARTITRKVREVFWAMQVERRYPKEEIMERYLNTVYFGRGAYGAEAAARTYFKVSAGNLTVGQAAFLAGLIRSPERFQIDEDAVEAVRLRDAVIQGMVKSNFLTEAKGKAAMKENLVSQFKPGSSVEVESPRAGYFVEYVRRILKSEFKLTDKEILRGGLEIHTTLDLKMQDAAEDAVSSVLDRPDDPEAALVAMGPRGEIRAMVGGRNVDSITRARGFNFAADAGEGGGGRQAGSAFKPFALAAFLSKGKSLESTFPGSSPIHIGSRRCQNEDGTAWEVSNFEKASFGALNVTAATLSSVNTVYAQMMNTVVTPSEFMRVAGKAGIDIPRFDAGCALALGTTDVTPLEMARGYTTFAQRGNRPDPMVIVKITRPNGEVVAERFPNVVQALERNVADSVNYVLQQNIKSGTGTSARIGRPAAGKTGTTQNFQNAWFAGYTPDLTAVIWMGYAPGPDGTIREMTNVRGREVTGGSLPATIWRRFMSTALQGTKPTSFARPRLGGEVLHFGPSKPSATLAKAEDPPANESQSSSSTTTTDPEPPVERPAIAQADIPAEISEAAAERPRRVDRQPSQDESMDDSCFPFCD